MKKNVGTIDRVARVILGLALLTAFAMHAGGQYNLLYLVGIVPLVTGLMSRCPLYSILGMRTCPLDHK